MAVVSLASGGFVDWADLVIGSAGAIAALVAVWLAARSAADARRSGDAAEASASASRSIAQTSAEQLRVMRAEAEAAATARSRRPRLTVVLHPVALQEDDQRLSDIPIPVGLYVHNRGNANAEMAQLTFSLRGERRSVSRCIDLSGAHPEPIGTSQSFDATGDPSSSGPWTDVNLTVDVPAGGQTDSFLLLRLNSGTHRIRAQVRHAEDDGGGRRHASGTLNVGHFSDTQPFWSQETS
jgi:hypothetical protein